MPSHIVVVVAEDEALLRMATAEVLRDEGFEVMEAEHAEDALRILQAKAAVVHVLFTDIHMPGTMDGLALAHHTAGRWPWVALLITSGRARLDSAVLPSKSRFLTKPYSHHRVVTHIRELAIS
ncbi:MAG: response regulator [Pseudomonadota bacterium]|nr:response regulator [Pseudomonadota bacterium]MDQ2765365.1 response regulator [Pseudomonadota bacterium]